MTIPKIKITNIEYISNYGDVKVSMFCGVHSCTVWNSYYCNIWEGVEGVSILFEGSEALLPYEHLFIEAALPHLRETWERRFFGERDYHEIMRVCELPPYTEWRQLNVQVERFQNACSKNGEHPDQVIERIKLFKSKSEAKKKEAREKKHFSQHKESILEDFEGLLY